MPYEINTIPYSGSIKNVTLGSGNNTVTVGGANSYPFHVFEGKIVNRPKIAMEVWDMEPQDWPKAVTEPLKDVISDPPAWAKKCVEEYGAEMIVVQMKSTDPNGDDRSADEAAAVVKKVVDAVDVPVIVWGVANVEKDAEVLKKVAEDCEGKHIALGPVEEANHKQIGAAALGYKHTIISSSPIDVNLAKQVNILLENLGIRDDLIIDPTTGGLGYGLEYSYSVMERIRMAGLVQEDDKLQYPIISNLGNEVWKSKEAKLTREEAPTMGDPDKRGYLMEAVAGVSYLLSGADILIMRHPESVKLIKKFIDLIVDGGSAYSSDLMAQKLEHIKEMPELLGIDVSFERKKAVVEEKKTAPKPQVKEKKKEEPKPKVEKAEKVKAEAKKEKAAEEPKKVTDKAAAEKLAQEAAAQEAAEKAAAENAAREAAEKAEAEKVAKEEAAKEAAEKAEAEKAAKEEAERQAAKAAQKEQEESRKAARLAERAKRSAETAVHENVEISMTPAAIQYTKLDKLVQFFKQGAQTLEGVLGCMEHQHKQ